MNWWVILETAMYVVLSLGFILFTLAMAESLKRQHKGSFISSLGAVLFVYGVIALFFFVIFLIYVGWETLMGR